MEYEYENAAVCVCVCVCVFEAGILHGTCTSLISMPIALGILPINFLPLSLPQIAEDLGTSPAVILHTAIIAV